MPAHPSPCPLPHPRHKERLEFVLAFDMVPDTVAFAGVACSWAQEGVARMQVLYVFVRMVLLVTSCLQPEGAEVPGTRVPGAVCRMGWFVGCVGRRVLWLVL